MKIKLKANKATVVDASQAPESAKVMKPAKQEPQMYHLHSDYASGIAGMAPGEDCVAELHGKVANCGVGTDSYDTSGKGNYAKMKVHKVVVRKKAAAAPGPKARNYEEAASQSRKMAKDADGDNDA